MNADGGSLDDKRQPLLPDEELGPLPAQALGKEEHAKNNLPDVLARWTGRTTTECERPRTAQSFCVPKEEIVKKSFDLSLNRYKEVVYEEVTHDPPQKILAELRTLEAEILRGIDELEEILK